MERKKYILFRMIFLLALLVNSGLTVYSNFGLSANNIELTPGENAVEPGLFSDNSLMFDDQTNQFYNFSITNLPESHAGELDDCSIIHNFSISVWHPPEIS